MNFNQFKSEVKKINFDSIRQENDNYFEAVILKKDLEELARILDNLLGKPLLVTEKELSAKIQDIIGAYGGLRKDQALYFLEQDSLSIFSMLWPWSDGYHVTLKSGQK
jgi:hypothetical protein